MAPPAGRRSASGAGCAYVPAGLVWVVITLAVAFHAGALFYVMLGSPVPEDAPPPPPRGPDAAAASWLRAAERADERTARMSSRRGDAGALAAQISSLRGDGRSVAAAARIGAGGAATTLGGGGGHRHDGAGAAGRPPAMTTGFSSFTAPAPAAVASAAPPPVVPRTSQAADPSDPNGISAFIRAHGTPPTDPPRCAAARREARGLAEAAAKPVVVATMTGHFFGAYERRVTPCSFRGCPLDCRCVRSLC